MPDSQKVQPILARVGAPMHERGSEGAGDLSGRVRGPEKLDHRSEQGRRRWGAGGRPSGQVHQACVVEAIRVGGEDSGRPFRSSVDVEDFSIRKVSRRPDASDAGGTTAPPRSIEPQDRASWPGSLQRS